MPRPRDPVRVRFGSETLFEVDPDWSYYGSLIFESRTGRHIGWVNGRSQTGWQVFHTNGHPLGTILNDGEVRDFRDALLGRLTAPPADAQVLDGVARVLDASLKHFA